MAILEVEHLNKSFENIEVLKDISFTLEKGQVLSIIGFGYKGQERKPFDESRLRWEKVHIGKFSLPEQEGGEA